MAVLKDELWKSVCIIFVAVLTTYRLDNVYVQYLRTIMICEYDSQSDSLLVSVIDEAFFDNEVTTRSQTSHSAPFQGQKKIDNP